MCPRLDQSWLISPVDFELSVLLSQPLQCWHYRYEQPHPFFKATSCGSLCSRVHSSQPKVMHWLSDTSRAYLFYIYQLEYKHIQVKQQQDNHSISECLFSWDHAWSNMVLNRCRYCCVTVSLIYFCLTRQGQNLREEHFSSTLNASIKSHIFLIAGTIAL